MKPKKILFLILAIICCIAADCDKEPKEKPIYYLDQEIKDYTLFPVGSYWIYEDSLSNDIDTVSIISQTIKIFAGGEEPFKYEYFKQNIVTSYYNDTLFGGGSAWLLESEGFCEYSETGWLRFISQKQVGYKFDELLYEIYYDSLFIINKWYKEVKVFTILTQDSSSLERCYFKKNIGIIKKEKYDGKVWELLNYYINN